MNDNSSFRNSTTSVKKRKQIFKVLDNKTSNKRSSSSFSVVSFQSRMEQLRLRDKEIELEVASSEDDQNDECTPKNPKFDLTFISPFNTGTNTMELSESSIYRTQQMSRNDKDLLLKKLIARTTNITYDTRLNTPSNNQKRDKLKLYVDLFQHVENRESQIQKRQKQI